MKVKWLKVTSASNGTFSILGTNKALVLEKEWKSVSAFSLAEKVTGHINNQILLGDKLGR